MNIKNKMRMLALGVLTLAVFIPTFTFAQKNKDVRDIPFVGPEPQPIVQQTVEQIPAQPQQQQPITIINNWPELQRPQPRIIYMPSRPRIVAPAEPVKKDTITIIQQPAVQQSSFLSDNGIIWCLIVLGLLLFTIIGYLIAGRRRDHYVYNGNCNGFRGNCGGDWNMNHRGRIDNVHTGTPTKMTHTHTHTGFPSEITLKVEMPPKVEEVVPSVTKSDSKSIGQQ